MKEVDPDVAALLEDLPKTKLPPALIKEGWGQHAMRDLFKSPKAPSTEQQPKYENTCFQCARPLTSRSGKWVDHSGRDWCDGAVVAEREFTWHVIESEIEFARDMVRRSKERQAELRRKHQAEQTAAAAARDAKDKAAAKPCSASRGSKDCQHKCMEKRSDHFGFHHCRYCGKLWG